MLVFEKFTKEKLKEYSTHLKNSGFLCNDFSIGSILAWGDFNKTEVAKIKDTLIVKQQVHGAPIFSFPFGNDVYGAIDGLIEYVSENNLPLAFCGVDDNLLYSIINLDKFSNCVYGFDRRWSDYIYDFEEMRTFQGKKFSGQRNHINKFIKLYGKPDFSEIEYEDLSDIKLMLEKYKQENAERLRTEDNEIIATQKLLENFREFDNFFGAKLKINGEIVSFSIGEIVGESLIIHAEKALKAFQGIYPTTFNCFINFVFSKTTKTPLYVNREDDSGDLGLRTSKTQYKPIFLVNKNVVRVNCPLAKITEHPVLIGEGVYLDQITEEDKENYFNLCVDEEINKMWPYNYKKDDSITESLSHDTFYKKQLHHNKIGTSINFAIREEKGGELLGETIVHNFTYNLGGEMGCRLLLSARGKKLGAKAYKLTADWAEQVLKVKITGKCLKENTPSYKMITSSGFSMIKDDGKYYYFQRKNAE